MGTYADEIFESLKKEKYSDRVFNQINQELSQKQQNNSQTVQRTNSDLHRTNAEKQSKSGDKVSAVGDSAYAGLTGINANIMGAVKAVDDFVWGDLFQRSDYRPLKPIYDYYLKENERAQAEKQSEIENGNLNPYVDALVSGTVQAVPTAVLGAMSGGTSLAGQAATTGANLSTAQLAANTAKEIAKNPNFIYSAVQTFGGTYEDAKQNGADTNTAIRAALLNAIPQSLIEVSGGTEKLVAKLANKTKGLAGDVFKSALEEGLEEVLQYPVEGIVKKTTYAPETPIFSTKESAVINPKEMAENFAVGASVGGILGGASAGTAKVFNTVVENNAKKQQALQQEQLENRAAIAQAMKMGIVQDISGKYNYSRIGSDGTVRIYSDVFQNVEPEKQRSFIKQYAQDNYITQFDNTGNIVGEDKGITIKSDNSRVYITGQGINEISKKIRGGKNEPFLNSILELPAIIENSVLVQKDIPDEKGRPFLWNLYQSKIYINKKPYTVSLKIKNPPTGGNRYYYHTIDEIKIESEPSHGTLATDNQSLPYLFSDYPDSSNPTIPQKLSGVNTSIRENSENMTENRQIRVSESELKVMKAIAKNHKIPFEIRDLGVDAKGSPIEGKYENGVIYVSPYAKKPSLVIFKHELTHYLEKDQYRYEQLLEVVRRYYDEMGETLGTDYAAEIRKIYDNYRARGKILEDGEAERELIANFAGKYLFTDEKAIQYLAKKRPNIARSIVNWIREQIAAIKGDAESELLIRAERMYLNALKAADKRTEFVFKEIKNAEPTSADMLDYSVDQGTAIGSASDTTVPQKAQDVNTSISDLQKNDTVGAKYSLSESSQNNKKITANMDENERAEVLRNSTVNLSVYDGNNEDLNAKNVILLKSSYNSQAGKILKSLGEKFGVFKSYSNENVSLDFDYPRVSLNESVHKQGNISTDFYDFAKMLYVFDDVVKNAVPIEVHTDKYKGTTRENPNLKYDYVLLSAFQDGDYIIPVEFHVKEMNEGATTNNKLYVSVTLGKIKIENERIKVETSDPNGRTSTLPTTFSNISIADLVKKINPEYGNFYKYIPSVLLDEKQQLSKNTAVKDENYRLKVMRGEDVSDLLREAAAEKGYTTDDNWKMDHKAPNSNDGYSNSMDKIDKSYGSDGSIYSSQAVYYYGEGREYDRKSISVIKSARNNPDKMIKIYRAVPTTVKDTRMRNGDWVAITKEYAEEHGGRVLDNDFRIIENTVPAKYLYSNGDSINEWGYDNGNQNEVYQNTKNNVKTVEVTYDDNGNIIPLSKRFDSAKSDPRYFLSDDYDNAVEQYGAIPPGENPARDVKVPKQMNDNTKVRRTVRTAMEASGTPGELVDRLKVDIANDVYDYKVVSDKSAVSSAKDRLDKWGLEKCYQYWKSLVNEDRKISKNDLALAEQMYIESAHNGDFKVSQELMVDIAEEATRAGQNAQSIRLLKNLTPEGRVYKIDKLVYRIQKEIDRKTNGKAKTIKVDENLKKRMLNAKSQEEMDAIEHMVHKNIAKQMPEPTKMEKAVRKWNEWRYLAMLGNPRTHIRNIFGNALFAPMVNGKNAIGIALERTLSKDNRTKARLTAKDKATIEFAKSDFDTVNAEESKSSKNKYNESLNGLDVEEKVFKNKALEWARKTNSNLLEWEDTKAKRKRYSKSFAQFIKARGWDYQNLTDSQLDSARNYAMREAKRATFQDTSEVANALNKLSHQNIATEVLVEGLLPFKKTPINILKRGVEYSPFGIAKGIKELAWDVKKGNMNASQAIDTLSCGLSGTAMMMVGVLLSSLGVLTSTSDDDKEGEFDKLSGNQEYALQFFGKSYTIDWIAPLSMPLFIGAEIENAVERGDADNGAGIGRVLDALTGISDPMFNLSMLQGINSSIKTVRYSDNPTVDLAANTVSGYLGQGIPTILGQTARTVDTTRRNSYYTPKDSAAGKLIDKTIKKTAAKIPGVSMLLEPYIDKWGNEQVADNWVLNAFENFASPGYYSENTNDSVTEEMARLYKATSDTGVVPHSAKSSLSTGGNTYRLSEKEYTQYQKTLGKASHEQLQKLINSTAYSNMSNEEKAVAVGKMYRYAEESAKVEFYKGRGIDFDDTPTIKKFNEVEESGVDLYDYLYAYVSVKDMESDKNASGETIRGSLKRKQISCMVNQLGIPAKTANKIYDLMH